MELGFDPLVILRLKPWQKIGIGLALFFLLMAGYGYFIFQDRYNQLDKLQKDIQLQGEQIASKRRLLNKLPQKRKELAILKAEEQRLAQKLPSEKEIPTLLTNISNAGHQQGLEFLLFATGSEISRGLYAEVPVKIEVRGSFHATAQFMDQVAKMSRIFTFADMVIEVTKGKEQHVLLTKARAATYRFLSEQALAQNERARKRKRKKRR